HEVIHVLPEGVFGVGSRNRKREGRWGISPDDGRREMGARFRVMNRHRRLDGLSKKGYRGFCVLCFHEHHVGCLTKVEESRYTGVTEPIEDLFSGPLAVPDTCQADPRSFLEADLIP